MTRRFCTGDQLKVEFLLKSSGTAKIFPSRAVLVNKIYEYIFLLSFTVRLILIYMTTKLISIISNIVDVYDDVSRIHFTKISLLFFLCLHKTFINRI